MLQLTNSTELSLPSSADSFTASQKISRILLKLRLRDHFNNSLPRDRNMSQINPAQQILKISTLFTLTNKTAFVSFHSMHSRTTVPFELGYVFVRLAKPNLGCYK
jgi:hypothetical protein